MPTFVGIDVAATKPIAIAALTGDRWEIRTSDVSRLRGAQRLAEVRTSVIDQVRRLQDLYGPQVAAIAVEIPFSTAKSFVLPSVAAVCCEVAGACFRDAVVIEAYAQKWRKAVLGAGNLKTEAAKARAFEVAAEHGLDTDSDDVAEAACLALYARLLWQEATGR